MTEMVERVADAILDSDAFANITQETSLIFARAAIKAMREPTDAMKEAGGNGVCGIIQDVGEKAEKHFVRLWRCAIDAALEDKKTGP